MFHWLTAALVLALVASGVIAKQLSDGAVANTLFSLHKLTGALTLTVVLIRLSYRFTGLETSATASYRHPVVHWMLYAVIIAVPPLGWAGISDFGSREIFLGYSLPAIWPRAPDTPTSCWSFTRTSRSPCWRWSRSTSAMRCMTTWCVRSDAAETKLGRALINTRCLPPPMATGKRTLLDVRFVPRTHAPQQNRRYSITSSARASTGIVNRLHGLASRTMLTCVSAARRTLLKPPALMISVSFACPACAPNAIPTSCESDTGTQAMVENA